MPLYQVKLNDGVYKHSLNIKAVNEQCAKEIVIQRFGCNIKINSFIALPLLTYKITICSGVSVFGIINDVETSPHYIIRAYSREDAEQKAKTDHIECRSTPANYIKVSECIIINN
jgi:hypothetical protein